ncbi:hypothetical protein XENOCAPTIV_022444 [Xenoophorus captivus]|uniref:Uncharacterized protein n=1 Tax=Xenoophorus captivus TaxID=1517983 RepID=A0ABV0S1V8_9TELE
MNTPLFCFCQDSFSVSLLFDAQLFVVLLTIYQAVQLEKVAEEAETIRGCTDQGFSWPILASDYRRPIFIFLFYLFLGIKKGIKCKGVIGRQSSLHSTTNEGVTT